MAFKPSTLAACISYACKGLLCQPGTHKPSPSSAEADVPPCCTTGLQAQQAMMAAVKQERFDDALSHAQTGGKEGGGTDQFMAIELQRGTGGSCAHQRECNAPRPCVLAAAALDPSNALVQEFLKVLQEKAALAGGWWTTKCCTLDRGLSPNSIPRMHQGMVTGAPPACGNIPPACHRCGTTTGSAQVSWSWPEWQAPGTFRPASLTCARTTPHIPSAAGACTHCPLSTQQLAHDAQRVVTMRTRQALLAARGWRRTRTRTGRQAAMRAMTVTRRAHQEARTMRMMSRCGAVRPTHTQTNVRTSCFVKQGRFLAAHSERAVCHADDDADAAGHKLFGPDGPCPAWPAACTMLHVALTPWRASRPHCCGPALHRTALKAGLHVCCLCPVRPHLMPACLTPPRLPCLALHAGRARGPAHSRG